MGVIAGAVVVVTGAAVVVVTAVSVTPRGVPALPRQIIQPMTPRTTRPARTMRSMRDDAPEAAGTYAGSSSIVLSPSGEPAGVDITSGRLPGAVTSRPSSSSIFERPVSISRISR